MCLKVVFFFFFMILSPLLFTYSSLTNLWNLTFYLYWSALLSFITYHVRDGHVYRIFNAMLMFITIFIVLHSSAIFSGESTTYCEKNKHSDKHCHCIRATIDMTIFNVIRYKMRYFISLWEQVVYQL